MEKESFFSSSDNLLPVLETNRESSYRMLNWGQSMNHNSHFGSAIVTGGGGVGEFSGEISSHSHHYISGVNTTANQSCQSDHLRSPPKLNLSILDHNHFAQSSHLGQFKDRDASFSCPGGRNYHGMPQCGVSRIGVVDVPIQNGSQFEMQLGTKFATVDGQFTGAREEPPKSDITVAYRISTRKRKPDQRGRTKDEPVSPVAENLTSVLDEENVNIKRLKSSENVDAGRDNIKTKVKQASSNNSVDGNSKTKEKNAELSEPPKQDYIHVRARRGQATDSHSLAERARREKISERMKFLQSLVPGCDKVTGKAVVLDEIINYVQSLQCQVEFLSMKLAALNPGMDFSMENVFRKDMNQSHSSLAHPVFSMDTSTPMFSSAVAPPNASLRSMMINGLQNHFPVNSSDSTMSRSLSIQMPAINGSGDSVAQAGNFWNSEHQNVGHMGFQQIHESMFFPPQLHGEALPSPHTKIEL